MTSEKSRQHLPPYISYRTFGNFLSRLQEQIPARIDRSYWGAMLSGSTGIQLMTALRFLGLIDDNAKPTDQLKLLASAKDEQRTEVLREITYEAYRFVLQSSFDLQNSTYAQLAEKFHDTFHLAPDVGRKCIKFFISLAADARMPLSPFMTKRFRWTHTSTGTTGTKSVIKRGGHRTNQNVIIPHDLAEIPQDKARDTLLLDKFPTFDPNWSDEVKLKWFTAFDELLKRYSIRPGKNSND